MPASIFNGDAVKILKNKLRFKDGTTVTSTEINDKKIKISATDTTPDHLNAKVNDDLGIIKSILNSGGNEQLNIKLGPHYLSLASSGLYTGGVLSVGATTGTFDITAGEGLWVDSTTAFPTVDVQAVIISAATNVAVTNIATNPVTYVMVDKDGNLIQLTSFPTADQRRQYIFIGVVVHSDNVNVNVVNNIPDVALDISAQVHDVMQGLGFFNLSGNAISANGANLSFDKSAGKSFKAGANFTNDPNDPHTLTLGAQVATTFRYRNQDSSEGSDVTLLDPTTYDNAGTTTTVPSNNNATIQRVYIFPSNAIRIQRGQTVYSNFSAAVDAVGKEAFTTEPNIEENGLLLASIVMKKTATDLTDSSEAQIFFATRFGDLGSVGSSSTGTLQQIYDNSTTPELTVDSTRGAVSIQDNATPIGASLFEVQSNGGGTTYFDVDVDGAFATRIDVDNIRLDGNILSTTNANGDLTITPNGTGKVVISSDLQINGTTTTVNSTTMDVADSNISVNVGGNQAAADSNDAGLTVEMSDATNALIHYDSTATSLFKIGALGSTVEVADISSSQALTNKTIDSDLNTITNIVNANIKASAAIDYSKLNLSGSVLNADISSSTVIDASKLEIYNVNTIAINTNAVANATYLVQSNSGAIQVTLPTPAVDAFVTIKDRDGNATANNITVARNGSESIENVAGNYTLDADGSSTTFVSDGTNWFIL